MGYAGSQILISILLLLGSIFFVAAEYALVSSRRSRIESFSRKGSKSAKKLLDDLDNLSPYVAVNQIGITMISIGVGSVTEPFVTEALRRALGPNVSPSASFFLSFILVSFSLVVVGELVPKYVALQRAEHLALIVIRPLRVMRWALSPLVWLAQNTASLILKPFGIRLDQAHSAMAKEELLVMIQSVGAEGTLDKLHADMVGKALRLDTLMARDIMVHRLDMKWLDLSATRDEVFRRVQEIPYTRLPVCSGDIDDLVGVVYLHDLVRNMDNPSFRLQDVMREPVAIPENLPVERIITTMRESKTQIVLVVDEYGGTSGLITLEDVVEEVFGELEDRIESERPTIDITPSGRISARAEVRFDELVSRLNLPIEAGENTETLAQIVVDALERVPRPGDSVESEIGTLRVENMARRRITRVSVQLNAALLSQMAEKVDS
jgi:CBS domain containing-hemolysin-like protein